MDTICTIHRTCYLTCKGMNNDQAESPHTLNSREYSRDGRQVCEIENPKITFSPESSYRDALAPRFLDGNRLGFRSIEHGYAGRIHAICL